MKPLPQTTKAEPKIIVGLTGGFCSGKSSVRLIFKELGARTFDCDQAAHEALKKNSPVYPSIVEIFGRNVLSKNGSVDRKKLGALVFANRKKKAALEKLIHPFVIERMQNFIQTHRGFLVLEVPLLFEAKLGRFFDYIVVVFTPRKEILKRARARFGLPFSRLQQRIDAQLPLGRKKQLADFVIHNDHPKRVVQQVLEIHNLLKTQITTEKKQRSP